MKIIDDQIRPHDTGGRSVEIPFISREFSGITNCKIADFGCMNGPNDDKRIGTSKYNISKLNTFFYFDLLDVPKLAGQYHRVDFTAPNFYQKECFDYGICVSVVEHIGLNAYGNKLDSKADIKAIKNMYDTIVHGGTLYITVPASDTFQMPLRWVRSYTPQMIREWGNNLDGSQIAFDLCKYIAPDWFVCEEEEFKHVKQYTNGQGIVGVACIKINKGII